MLNFHYKYSYRIKVPVKSNKKRCILFVPFSNTIWRRFGVSGSHDREAIEKKHYLIKIFVQNKYITH